MKASARFEQDDAYFVQLYEDWLRHGSKVRRWQPWIGLSSCGMGVMLSIFGPQFRTISVLLVTFGIFQVIENILYRRSWLKSRVAARRHKEHNEISLEFDEDGITHTGPTSSGVMKWSAVTGVRETPRGISLSVGDGMSMYIPKSAVEPADAIQDIVNYARRGV